MFLRFYYFWYWGVCYVWSLRGCFVGWRLFYLVSLWRFGHICTLLHDYHTGIGIQNGIWCLQCDISLGYNDLLMDSWGSPRTDWGITSCWRPRVLVDRQMHRDSLWLDRMATVSPFTYFFILVSKRFYLSFM